MPKLSIVIPAYNGAPHIAAALDSVLAAPEIDKEIIVVDDNSRDETAAIVAGYAERGVRLERNAANLGPGGNWNRALALASGTYVKLLPQDDLVAPGALAAQIAVLDADRDEAIALVFGARTIVDAAGRTVMRRGLARRRSGPMPAAALIRACVRGGTNQVGEPGGVLFRRSLATRIGGFDGGNFYVIDVDYWLRLLAHGDAYYLDTIVSSFRVDTGSSSVRMMKRQAADYRRFLDDARAKGLIADRPLDIAIGKLAAQANMLARRLVYRFFVR